MAAPTNTATAADPLSSPAISAYSFVSAVSQPLRSDSDDSDDEIVWSVSDGFASSSNSSANGSSEDGVGSDDDYVLLTHPASAAVSIAGLSTPDAEAPGASVALTTQNLEAQMNALSLSASTSKKARAKKAAKSANAAANVGTGITSVKPKPKRKKKTKKIVNPVSAGIGAASPPSATQKEESREIALVKQTRGLGARPIVDDFSDGQSIISYDHESSAESPTLYEEASAFISSFLSNPDAKNDSVYRLTLLQSIIIELGLATATLPKSLRAAKAFVKSRVFLNIREYLAVREQGPEAVQRAMYPSKSALIKDIRRNPTSLKWVKAHGLQVLLVGWMQH